MKTLKLVFSKWPSQHMQPLKICHIQICWSRNLILSIKITSRICRFETCRYLKLRNFKLRLILWEQVTITELVRSWILTFRQPHRVTSGCVTRSNFFHTSSKHEWLDHRFVWFTVTASKTNPPSICKCTIVYVLLRQKTISTPFLRAYLDTHWLIDWWSLI